MDLIRKMTSDDASAVIEMMRVFYASDAVSTNGSEEIFIADVENCTNGSPYLEGFVIEREGQIIGYTMVAKSFSTEFGKRCIWIEDLYIKDNFRGSGVGKAILNFITERYQDCIFRLEVEEENENAVKLYKKCGFDVLPYMEMKKLI